MLDKKKKRKKGSKRCWGSDNNPCVRNTNDAWEHTSVSYRLRCLNDEYDEVINTVSNNLQDTDTQHNANINGYIATGGLQTTLDKWLSNKTDTIQKLPATRRRWNDNFRWSTDFICNNAVNDVWSSHLLANDCNA